MLPTSRQHQYQLLCLKEFQHKLLVRSCIYKHYSKDLSSFHSFLTVFGGKEGKGGGGGREALGTRLLKTYNEDQVKMKVAERGLC